MYHRLYRCTEIITEHFVNAWKLQNSAPRLTPRQHNYLPDLLKCYGSVKIDVHNRTESKLRRTPWSFFPTPSPRPLGALKFPMSVLTARLHFSYENEPAKGKTVGKQSGISA